MARDDALYTAVFEFYCQMFDKRACAWCAVFDETKLLDLKPFKNGSKKPVAMHQVHHF